jgi:capsular polysaccharide biosynthesis protein
MELRELSDRLLRLHARLIIALVLAGVLGGLAVHLRDTPQYQANVVLVLGAPDPQSAAEAAVLADTGRGIATGPRLVSRAISAAGVSRDEATVANTINVQSSGSSGVLTLSVTDQNPRVAVKLANAVADSVVNTRIALTRNRLATTLRNLGRQEASTNAEIRKLDAKAASLAAKIAAGSSPASGQSPELAELSQLQARLTSLQGLAAQIIAQRNGLEAQFGPKTTVIDQATSAVSIPGRGLLDVLLGGMLGLIVGIAIAAAREVMRPSLVGAAPIARAIGTPLLGEMSTPPDSWTVAALPDAGTYVELAASSQQVQEVRFAALDPHGRLGTRVRMLEGPLHRLRFDQSLAPSPLAGAGAANDGPPAERVPGPAATASPAADPPDGRNSLRIGLVVAMPRVLKLSDVDALTNFIWISGWTLLGVIVYGPSWKTMKSARSDPDSAKSQQDSSLGGQVEVDA